jgi:hypothetical protein
MLTVHSFRGKGDFLLPLTFSLGGERTGTWFSSQQI